MSDGIRFEHLHVTESHDGRLLHLRLDHGKANEIGTAVLRELEGLTHHLEQHEVAALVTYSERRSRKGTPIFVAGANVTERLEWSDDQVKSHVRWQRSVLAALRRAPVLHVVVVNGVALGWGTEFLLTADWRIAADGAVFGLPETGLGIVPGAGGTSELWAEIGVGHALRLGMTGEQLSADAAAAIGLVHERAASVEEGLARAEALAQRVLTRSPTAVAAFKRGVLASVGRGPGDRVSIEDDAYTQCVDSGEAAIGRASFDQVRAGERPPWGPRSLGGDTHRS